MLKPFFWAFAVDCVLLGYCGSQSVDAAWKPRRNFGSAHLGGAAWHHLLLRIFLARAAADRPGRTSAGVAGQHCKTRARTRHGFPFARRVRIADMSTVVRASLSLCALLMLGDAAIAQTATDARPPKSVAFSLRVRSGLTIAAHCSAVFRSTRKSARPATASIASPSTIWRILAARASRTRRRKRSPRPTRFPPNRTTRGALRQQRESPDASWHRGR